MPRLPQNSMPSCSTGLVFLDSKLVSLLQVQRATARAQHAMMLAATPQQLRSLASSRSPSPASPYEARHLLAAGNVSDRMDSAGEQCLLVRMFMHEAGIAGSGVSSFKLTISLKLTCLCHLQQLGSHQAICLPVQQGSSVADKEHAAASALWPNFGTCLLR